MRTLIAAKCPGITLNSMHGFPELRHLDLTGCEGIAPGTAVSLLSRIQDKALVGSCYAHAITASTQTVRETGTCSQFRHWRDTSKGPWVAGQGKV